MRIKRFSAPDMRTALRMVRDEQGPDAVILSNRATADGIEVVAATDYDESLVTQALRAAVPDLESATPVLAAKSFVPTTPVTAPAVATVVTSAASVAPRAPTPNVLEPLAVAHAEVAFATRPVVAAAANESRIAPRESLVSRARAIFRIGDGPAPDEGPTLAELTAASMAPSVPAVASMPRQATSRFEDMMAAFNAPSADRACVSASAPIVPAAPVEPPADAVPANVIEDHAHDDAPSSSDACAAYEECDADYLISLATGQAGATPSNDDVAPGAPAIPAGRPLHAMAVDATETDPAILAMRRELAAMRQLMERQMEQLSLERLRGSPARAAAFEALLGLGCDSALAQTIAAKLDPRIAQDDLHEAMLTELMRTLPIARHEPIEDGGVIALVGPTGAGKTTTAAKLAARFAARHRARDVALVSIDRERTGAREQLHALGRRLGVTVCDAESSDTLGRALEQLADYPLVLVDTAGYGMRDRALLRQILWLRSSSHLRSLLVLPANAHPHDLADIVRRYRPAAPEGAVLTKLDEAGRPGASLSVLAQYELPLAYTSSGQQVPDDIDAGVEALGESLRSHVLERRAVEKLALEKTPGAADNPLAIEDRHAFA